jgi:negative regulator of sigma-B (phosphoserine phosphatase)
VIEWGVAAAALGGQRESGDRYVVAPFGPGALAAVIDGLGHGEDAAYAAQRAADILATHAHESVIALVRRCHEHLRTTRGVVMSLASFDAQDETMAWLGVGNVEGRLLRANPDASPAREFLLMRGGVVGGSQLPQLRADLIPVVRGDTLLLVTDGVFMPPAPEVDPGQPPQVLANRMLARHRKATDDALVLVVRWVGP